MTTIHHQLAAPPGVGSRKCYLCEASDVTKKKYDELRRRMESWDDAFRNHEQNDVEFTMRKSYNQYVNMVSNSRSSREQQACDRDKQDIVRYHTMSYETFAAHFCEPHHPTRETRNVQKNDAIEHIYAKHLALMDKYLDAYAREGKESDLKCYNDLAKIMKNINDVSVSPRFVSFHTVRKNIHK